MKHTSVLITECYIKTAKKKKLENLRYTKVGSRDDMFR